MRARKTVRFSRSYVGRALDVDSSTVYRWENDLSSPSLGDVERLADLYSHRAAWLAFGDGKMAAVKKPAA